MKLVLETKQGPVAEPQPLAPVGVITTPPITPEYWLFRVKVSETQAIVGFPKFFQCGIGFAVEKDDWNTNLPSTCEAEEIYEHIKVNKGDKKITKASCIKAIKMIQQAWKDSEQATSAKSKS